MLEDLHDEALVAIRAPSPSGYSAIAELYEHLLLVLPETWARYGQQYTGGIEGGANPFELSVQDYLERHLYEQMTQAARSGSRDVAHDALDLPITVAQRALELRALALTKRMMLLWVAARRSMLRYADDEDIQNLLGWSWLRLSEYAVRPEMLVTDDGSDPHARELGRNALLQVWDGYAAICKDVLDVRPRDTELLAEINELWDQPLQHWDPEYARPHEFELQHAIDRGEPAQAVERLRVAVEENQAKAEVKREIVDWRALIGSACCSGSSATSASVVMRIGGWRHGGRSRATSVTCRDSRKSSTRESKLTGKSAADGPIGCSTRFRSGRFIASRLIWSSSRRSLFSRFHSSRRMGQRHRLSR